MCDAPRAGCLSRLFRGGLMLIGGATVVLVALAFTSIPYRAYARLAIASFGETGTPAAVLVLGGGGIPSESGLMRCFVAAEVARAFPETRVVLALPGDVHDPDSGVRGMRDELMMRGVHGDRITMEAEGRNTHEQAVALADMLTADGPSPSVLVVTSPEHVRRAVLSLRKAGFDRVRGVAAFEESAEPDLKILPDDADGESSSPLSVVDANLVVRYRFWTNLNYELRAAREYAALAYYRLRGWI